MPEQMVLQAEHVSLKKKNGLILDDVTLSVGEGCFFGLVGDRDAGKTAFLRVAAGLERADAGNVNICGLPVAGHKFRSQRGSLVGYMQQANGRYPGLSVLDYMELYAHMSGLYGLSGRERCVEVLSYAGMERRTEQMFDELNAGEKRLIALVRLMLKKLPLLLLDEPFFGVLRSQRLLMEELLSGLVSEGTAVVMSTEDFGSVVDLCSHIGTLKGGVLTQQGTVEEVLAKTRSEMPVHLRVLKDADRAAAVLRKIPEVKTISMDNDHLMIRFLGDASAEAKLLSYLADEGIMFYAFYREVQEAGEGK